MCSDHHAPIAASSRIEGYFLFHLLKEFGEVVFLMLWLIIKLEWLSHRRWCNILLAIKCFGSCLEIARVLIDQLVDARALLKHRPAWPMRPCNGIALLQDCLREFSRIWHLSGTFLKLLLFGRLFVYSGLRHDVLSSSINSPSINA